MMLELSLQNFFAWTIQISVIVLTGALLPWIFGIRHPRSHLLYCQFLLLTCIAIPFVQPWEPPAVSGGDGGPSYLADFVDDPVMLQANAQLPLAHIIFWIVAA